MWTWSFLRNSKFPRKPAVSKVQVNGALDLFKILFEASLPVSEFKIPVFRSSCIVISIILSSCISLSISYHPILTLGMPINRKRKQRSWNKWEKNKIFTWTAVYNNCNIRVYSVRIARFRRNKLFSELSIVIYLKYCTTQQIVHKFDVANKLCAEVL